MSKVNKYFHLIMATAFMISAITAIIVLTQFSQSDIITLLEKYMANSHFHIAHDDSLAIVKAIQEKIWNIHIVSGVTLFFAYLIFISRVMNTPLFRLRNLRYYSYVLSMILPLMFITGLLYFQTFIDISTEYKEVYINIHYYLAFIIGGAVSYHIYDRIMGKRK